MDTQGRKVKLQIVVVEAPAAFVGFDAIELLLSTKDGFFAPVQKSPEELRFEVEVEIRPDRNGDLQGWGPAVNRQGDGIRFIYLTWFGIQAGMKSQFRRMKVGLDQVPGFPGEAEHYEVRVKGTDKRGCPACARATVAS